MSKIQKLFKTKYGGLIFSLISGLAYFVIVTDFLSNTNGGILLGFFFSPAIVCASALVLLKTAKKLLEEERYKKLNILFFVHLVLVLISLAFLADIISKYFCR